MPGGRPPKSVDELTGHRTKDEKSQRKTAEQSMLTGIPMREAAEVKANETAHKEWLRIKKLFKSINKDDDIYANALNTHCRLVAECIQIENFKSTFLDELNDYDKNADNSGMKYEDKIKTRLKIQEMILDCDKQLMAKRKMIFDISKENIMTVQSALRAIPKKPESKKKSAMAAFMEHRAGGS